jgi:CBS domain-containing protein
MAISIEGPLYTATGSSHVRDAMAKTICSAQTEDTIQHIAQMMKETGCGFLPVTDEGTLAGVITDRDIALKLAEVGAPQLEAMRAWEIMSEPVIAIFADDTLDHAGQIMAKHQVRRLPVTDGGRLVGVLSLGNLVQALHGEGAAQFAVLGVTRGA